MAGKKRAEELKLNSEQQERLIELIQQEPDLWNVLSSPYSKKESRQKALRTINCCKLKEDYEGLECNGKFIMQLNNFCSLHEIINKNCKGLMLLSINLLVIQCWFRFKFCCSKSNTSKNIIFERVLL